MNRLIWLAGLAGVAAIALLIGFRGQAAAAVPAPGCTSTDAFLPAFCLNAPSTGVRRETTVPLIGLPSVRADVRVQIGVPGADAIALALGVDRSVERVERLFGRTFSARPRVLVFADATSFAQGAVDLFGYSRLTADAVANTYGGIFDRPTATIAVNWGASGSDRMSAAIAHELTHLMIREIVAGTQVRAWLDEGIATLVEQDAARGSIWLADEQLTGRAVATSGTISLAQLETVADFHAAYARLDRPLYAFSAEAVRTMQLRIGWDGVVRVLAASGNGAVFDRAYQAEARETLAALERRLSLSAPSGIVSNPVADTNGNRLYTLYAGVAGADVTVSITSTTGYAVSFSVRTDAFGMYRGSFGSTAPAGLYTVRAAGAAATFATSR